MKCSVIVSTYNRPDALNAVLIGLSQQNFHSDWEVIVADDGSRIETHSLVESWKTRFPTFLRHVWQEDVGFRLATIRNRATAKAQGDYLVFLDGDCVPFPDFVSLHLKLSEPGWFVAGSRVSLAQNFTKELLTSLSPAECVYWNSVQWLRARIRNQIRGKIDGAFPWLRVGLSPLRKLRRYRWKGVRGCNIGVSKEAYLQINGFDESFSGWGNEDFDFAIRLIRSGSLLKDGRYAVPVLHLWHPENDRSRLPQNLDLLNKLLNSDRIRAIRGVDQYF